MDEDGIKAAESEGKEGTIRLGKAHLWQVRNAYLYTLCITLEENGSILDTYTLEIGIREVKIEGESILINGRPVYLKASASMKTAISWEEASI